MPRSVVQVYLDSPALHWVKSYVSLIAFSPWFHRQAVKTSPFHGEVGSSNLPGITNIICVNLYYRGLYIFPNNIVNPLIYNRLSVVKYGKLV